MRPSAELIVVPIPALKFLWFALGLVWLAGPSVLAAQPVRERLYTLGPGDQIIVRVPDLKEIPDDPVQVDPQGYISLPLIGRVEARGKTLDQLEAELKQILRKYLKDPEVTVAISEFRSQPVSVFGAVQRPGVIQLHGPRTLWEVISEAGGLTNDAGATVKIMRRLEEGELPLPGARIDESGRYSVAEIDVKSVIEMTNPEQNILVRPHDVITVSQANIVYVVGRVQKPGGFVTKGSLSVLEALSLAGGFAPNAAPTKARILRRKPGTDERIEIAINLKDLLKGKIEDMTLKPDDILFVPYSGFREFSRQAAAASLAVATGIAIYRVGLDR